MRANSSNEPTTRHLNARSTPIVGVTFTAKRLVLLAGALAIAAAMSVLAYMYGGIVNTADYGPNDLREGPRSQIVAWPDSNTAVQISRLSKLQPDHLWKVVTDQKRFDEFMPYVRETTVEALEDGSFLEKQILDLPVGSYDLDLRIKLTAAGNVRRAAWEQQRGTLSYNAGAWIVEKHGDESILRYQVAARVGWLPQWMSNSAMRGRLGKLLEAVEARTVSLEQNEQGYFQ
jgi:hypothetical protein